VAKRIRAEPHGRDMLLLALTGYSEPGAAHVASEHGFDYHLMKPIDMDQLTRLLNGTAAGSSQAELST
jgi:CheY-like chemotaxis protein